MALGALLNSLVSVAAIDNSIDNFTLKTKFFTLSDIFKTHTFGRNIAFFYHLQANGIFNDDSVTGDFLKVKTAHDFYDFSPLVTLSSDCKLDHAESNFIWQCPDFVEFDLSVGSSAMFSEIKNLSLYYLLLIPKK